MPECLQLGASYYSSFQLERLEVGDDAGVGLVEGIMMGLMLMIGLLGQRWKLGLFWKRMRLVKLLRRVEFWSWLGCQAEVIDLWDVIE